jgi:hypothetical protein
MTYIDKLPGLTREELSDAIKAGCKGPVFYRVTVESIALNGPALQREQGLMQLLGGSAALASVFSPDQHLAKIVDTSTRYVSIEDAVSLPVLALLEDK